MHASASDRSLRAARALLALLLLAVTIAGAAVSASSSAHAQTPDSFEGEVEVTVGDSLVPSRRFAGGDRVETSGLLATDDTDAQPFDPAAFDDGTVILARSELEFDALAGSTLGGLEDAPIVLTPPDTASDGGELNPDTLATLEAIESLEQIFLLGNEAAIGDDVEAALAEQFPEADITRVGGINRFETAAQISSRVPESEDVIIARADLAVDALVAGSIAATEDVPILLTGQSGPLDPFAEAELQRLDPDRVLIAGGPGAIAEDTEADIQATVPDADIQRVAGNNRFSTAVRFAQLGTDEFGFGTDHVNLARADVSFDALALGPHAALDVNGPAPIVLTSPDDLPDETEEYFGGEDVTPNEDLGGGIADCLFESLDIAGGIAAVGDAVELEARQVLSQAPGERCNVELTPETATNLVGETHTVTATVTDNALDPAESGTVTFEVDSDDGGDDDSVVILSDDEVEIDENGEAEFDFTSTEEGSFTITATVTDNDGNVETDTARKDFVPGPTPEPAADLELNKTTDMDSITVGDTVTFTLEVVDNGPETATGVTVTDDLPDNVTFVSATANSEDGAGCTVTGADPNNGTVTCDLGTLGVAETETVEIVVEANTPGTIENTAFAAGNQEDPDETNNDDTATVTVNERVADLALTKTADSPRVTEGDSITFTIDVFNDGPDDAVDVFVTDELPENTTFESASAECTITEGTVTCDLDTVDADTTETVTITVTADEPGQVNNVASVDTASDDPDDMNNSDDETVTVDEDQPPA